VQHRAEDLLAQVLDGADLERHRRQQARERGGAGRRLANQRGLAPQPLDMARDRRVRLGVDQRTDVGREVGRVAQPRMDAENADLIEACAN
jgi:hypothetical protein